MKSEIDKGIAIPAGAEETIPFDHFNQSEVRFNTGAKDFVLTFRNSLDEKVVLTMNSEEKVFSLDRVASGKINFQEDFGSKVQQMPIPVLPEEAYEVRILMDWSSIELFINGGQYVMTAQLFPTAPYTELQISNPLNSGVELKNFEVNRAETIW
jgi:fructan beta-fructosidase